ncbi:hypothetical protein [Streptomyces sp. NPDC046332]|uniref:hypothetical protein n=1 Tax=unclassified Streptomyces TaxID=2593676 RepID=UPI0033E8E789
MPLPTPNRGYPYSVPGDPADVPAAIQALAEAVDADAATLQSLVGPRPMARLRGSTQVVNQANIIPSDLPLETVDFNIGGAVGPIVNGRAEILLDGLWFMFATLVYPAFVPAANIDYVSLQIYNPATNDEFAVNAVHSSPLLAEISRQMDVGGSVLVLSGNNPQQVSLRSEVGRTAGTAQYPLRERTLTLVRMTDRF